MSRKIIIALLAIFLAFPVIIRAGMLDDVFKIFESASGKELDENTVVSGLKEALEVGTKNAVKNVSRIDGYFGNEIIKILIPDRIAKVADVLTTFGFEQEVDEFIKSMNRAAEKAAPNAVAIFVDSIQEINFDDARKILAGDDTTATEYFQKKTSQRLFNAFKPIVSSAMNDVGVTRNFKEMMSKYEKIPLMESVHIDLDTYVTNEALDGLFHMVGEEEKKIREDPAARVTELLQKVFADK